MHHVHAAAISSAPPLMSRFVARARACRRSDMVRLLDDHCARENRRRGRGGEPRAEYDLVYVRMDFG